MTTLKTKETAIQRMILDGLTRMGFLVWRNQQIPVPIRRGSAIVGLRRADPHTVGLPDIMLIERGSGRLVGIEVKTETGRQTPEQKLWQAQFESCGARYILARSWDDVASGLNLKN